MVLGTFPFTCFISKLKMKQINDSKLLSQNAFMHNLKVIYPVIIKM